MKQLYIILLAAIAFSCTMKQPDKNLETKKPKRFFSDQSLWNQPLVENPEIDSRSPKWIEMLKTEPTKNNFSPQYIVYTIPVYEVDSTTPVVNVKFHYLTPALKKLWDTTKERFGHGSGFNPVPIPADALPDPEGDHHLAVIDWGRMLAWDMWGCEKLPDGSWASNTGMKYKLNGSGVFDTADFNIANGESVHFYGPSRAPGVPAIAGLIMYEEVAAGEIRHKLSFGSRYVALQEFACPPAIWTDGVVPGGIPEGSVIQLDPKLDLSKFDLTPEEKIVAIALQKYGMVLVDGAGGQPIYVEGLYGHHGKSWKGKLREWGKKGINSIPYDNYRVLKAEKIVYKGDAKSLLSKKGSHKSTSR